MASVHPSSSEWPALSPSPFTSPTSKRPLPRPPMSPMSPLSTSPAHPLSLHSTGSTLVSSPPTPRSPFASIDPELSPRARAPMSPLSSHSVIGWDQSIPKSPPRVQFDTFDLVHSSPVQHTHPFTHPHTHPHTQPHPSPKPKTKPSLSKLQKPWPSPLARKGSLPKPKASLQAKSNPCARGHRPTISEPLNTVHVASGYTRAQLADIFPHATAPQDPQPQSPQEQRRTHRRSLSAPVTLSALAPTPTSNVTRLPLCIEVTTETHTFTTPHTPLVAPTYTPRFRKDKPPVTPHSPDVYANEMHCSDLHGISPAPSNFDHGDAYHEEHGAYTYAYAGETPLLGLDLLTAPASPAASDSPLLPRTPGCPDLLSIPSTAASASSADASDEYESDESDESHDEATPPIHVPSRTHYSRVHLSPHLSPDNSPHRSPITRFIPARSASRSSTTSTSSSSSVSSESSESSESATAILSPTVTSAPAIAPAQPHSSPVPSPTFPLTSPAHIAPPPSPSPISQISHLPTPPTLAPKPAPSNAHLDTRWSTSVPTQIPAHQAAAAGIRFTIPGRLDLKQCFVINAAVRGQLRLFGLPPSTPSWSPSVRMLAGTQVLCMDLHFPTWWDMRFSQLINVPFSEVERAIAQVIITLVDKPVFMTNSLPPPLLKKGDVRGHR